MVEQMVGVLQILDTTTAAEQVINVPKISCPSRPLRVALAASQMAEQLVEVPVHPFRECAITKAELEEEIMALARDAAGHTWFHVRGPRRPTGGCRAHDTLGPHRRGSRPRAV